MDPGIQPLRTEDLKESNPLMSRFSVRELAVQTHQLAVKIERVVDEGGLNMWGVPKYFPEMQQE